MGMEEIITGPDWESPFVDRDPNDSLDNADDDLSFTPAETESGQASPSMTLTSATVTFDPKKKDKFVLKGTTGSLSLTGSQSVIFEAGSFSQEITIDKFTKSKEKYTFKGTTGQAGIASLILDMPKGQFSATVQNIFLSGFTNPLPVSLKAGTSAECSMAQFSVNKNKWTFSKASNPQYACLMVEPPQATPTGMFTNTPSDIHIQVKVESDPDLDRNEIKLFRVDQNVNNLGDVVCSLIDDGNPANGDEIEGDGIYSCISQLNEGSTGIIRLAVRAKLAESFVWSPSITLDVVLPLTDEELQASLATNQEADALYEQCLAQYGDTDKARSEAIKAIKNLSGIKTVGLSPDKLTITMEFQSGVRGNLIPGVPTATAAGVTTDKYFLKEVEPSSEEPARGRGMGDSCRSLGATNSNQDRVQNCSVFIYSPFFDEFSQVVDPSGTPLRILT